MLAAQVLHLKYKFSSAIVFLAEHFQPLVATSFFAALAELVIVENLNIRTPFPTLLSLSSRLGLHTHVCLMTRQHGYSCVQLECTIFSLADAQTRPWGIEIPGQCPQCGSISAWKKASLTNGPGVVKYAYSCQFSQCGTEQRLDPYKVIITKPPGVLVNAARTSSCGWFQSPSSFFAELSPPSKGKRKTGALIGSSAPKKARKGR
ncbi:hypothetical protein K503DRAFT_772460 [Rhizopogon vinicolor AM-OR11-026]|uniref:Uncharacterized protein n=1 Tax=Rhizopogon vinicolor AM-OR11-026 TaxID=1314800 RepID=A0A1B7MV84_9AGAM|nr:hypothetical protein K503DRAFT_772460 [Rhizopogon vinicolor AM-OR11-026]